MTPVLIEWAGMKVVVIEDAEMNVIFWITKIEDRTDRLTCASGKRVGYDSSGFPFILGADVRFFDIQGDQNPWETLLRLCSELATWKEVMQTLQMEQVL